MILLKISSQAEKGISHFVIIKSIVVRMVRLFNFTGCVYTNNSIKRTLQDSYVSIHDLITYDPARLARIMYSKHFIDRSTLQTVTDSQNTMTASVKADILAQKIEDFILLNKDPNTMLMKLLTIFEEFEPIGPNVADFIRQVRKI